MVKGNTSDSISELREQAAAEFAMQYAYVDILTGVLNRKAFDRDFQMFDSYAQVGLIYCDINNLKEINKTRGHRKGDELLINFSALLKKNFPADSIYRFDGDEFICIILNVDHRTFEKRVKEFIGNVEDHGNIATIGYSFGSLANTFALLVKEHTPDDEKM